MIYINKVLLKTKTKQENMSGGEERRGGEIPKTKKVHKVTCMYVFYKQSSANI